MKKGLFLFVLLVLVTTAVYPDRILLKAGNTVEGRIIQQSRTSIQVQTADGRVLTISKAEIRRIDYGEAPRVEEPTRVETERKEDRQQQKQEQREPTKGEVEPVTEEGRQDRSSPDSHEGWWLEPFLSSGRGTFRSGLEMVYDRYQKGEQLFLLLDPGVVQSAPFQTDWKYGAHSVTQAGLRGGRGRWIGEMEVTEHQARPDFLFDVHSGLAVDSGMNWAYGVHVNRLKESYAALRVGYRFYSTPVWSAAFFGGIRSLNARADYTLAGQSHLFGPGTDVTTGLVSAGSTMGLSGRGMEVAAESDWRSQSLPVTVRGRLTLFQQDIDSELQDNLVSDPGASGVPFLDFNHEKAAYRFRGYVLALRTSYRVAYDVDIFLEYSIMRTDAELREVGSRLYAGIGADGSTFAVPPEQLIATGLLSASYAPERKRAEQARSIMLGVSRRFWL